MQKTFNIVASLVLVGVLANQLRIAGSMQSVAGNQKTIMDITKLENDARKKEIDAIMGLMDQQKTLNDSLTTMAIKALKRTDMHADLLLDMRIREDRREKSDKEAAEYYRKLWNERREEESKSK